MEILKAYDPLITIRPERSGDIEAIRLVNRQAFETSAEAALVDKLRAKRILIVSLVACDGGEVVGHIAFSPVSLVSAPNLCGAGLGPMAVLPEKQKSGIGSALVQAGLDKCRELGCDYAVVVGHTEYYPRFGFLPASQFGLRTKWDLPEGVFMAMEFKPGTLGGVSGLVEYQSEFDEV